MNEEINKILNWIEISYTNLNYKEELLIVNYIKKLQQENQQIKEENNILKEHHQEVVGYAYDLMLKRDKYKSVLDEIIEHIKEHKEYLEKAKEMYIGCNDELLKSTCIQLINNELVRSDNLLQILDKVKE